MQNNHLLERFLAMSPLLLVQVAGIVLACIAMRSARRRGAAVMLVLGLLTLMGTQIGAVLFSNYMMEADMQGRMSHAERVNLMKVVGFIDVGIDAIGMALLICAALGWRGGSEMGGAAGAGGPVAAANPPPRGMPLLSRGLRLTAMYVPMVLGVVCTFAAFIVGPRRGGEVPGLILLGVAVLLMIVGVVAHAMTIHALWTTLQPPPRGVGVERGARTSPGMAVGFLFIPLFNFYWLFQVWVGFATDCNRTLRERGVTAVPVPRGLAVAVCVCTLVSMIPYVGLVGSLANLVMFPILLWGSMTAANALRGAGG